MMTVVGLDPGIGMTAGGQGPGLVIVRGGGHVIVTTISGDLVRGHVIVTMGGGDHVQHPSYCPLQVKKLSELDFHLARNLSLVRAMSHYSFFFFLSVFFFTGCSQLHTPAMTSCTVHV